MIPPEKPDNELPELITRMAIAFVLVMLAIAFLFGCARPVVPREAVGKNLTHGLNSDESNTGG